MTTEDMCLIWSQFSPTFSFNLSVSRGCMLFSCSTWSCSCSILSGSFHNNPQLQITRWVKLINDPSSIINSHKSGKPAISKDWSLTNNPAEKVIVLAVYERGRNSRNFKRVSFLRTSIKSVSDLSDEDKISLTRLDGNENSGSGPRRYNLVRLVFFANCVPICISFPNISLRDWRLRTAAMESTNSFLNRCWPKVVMENFHLQSVPPDIIYPKPIRNR